jgi:hypothetical protein
MGISVKKALEKMKLNSYYLIYTHSEMYFFSSEVDGKLRVLNKRFLTENLQTLEDEEFNKGNIERKVED